MKRRFPDDARAVDFLPYRLSYRLDFETTAKDLYETKDLTRLPNVGPITATKILAIIYGEKS